MGKHTEISLLRKGQHISFPRLHTKLRGMWILVTVLCFMMLTACGGNKGADVATDTEAGLQNKQDVLQSSTEDVYGPSREIALQESLLAAKVEVAESKKVNIRAVGDIMLGRGVGGRIQGDYIYPFKKVGDFLKDADITFANLEMSISNRGQKLIGKGVWLQADPKSVEGLKYIGLDVANIANNHILDFNDIAMFDTIDILDENNILHIGAGARLKEARQPAVVTIEGVRVGFLGYTDLYQYGYGVPGQEALRYLEAKEDAAGVAPLKYDLIKEDVEALREDVDILVVSLHWGTEESFVVSPEQRTLAHKILDDGADLILGHHPHQLQGIEIYNQKPIVYSMGNFIFDQNDKENNETVIVDVDFTDGKLSRFEVVPCKIVGKKQTVFAGEEDGTHILGYLKAFSEELDTALVIEDGKLIYKVE